MTQAELNSFCHVLFCAIANDTGYKATSQDIYRSFKLRLQVIDQKFGEGTSNPATFAQMLVDSNLNETQKAKDLLKDIRLLPARGKFKKQIQRWAAAALDELQSDF